MASLHLDVDILFGRSFEEFESELIGELFASFVGDDALVFHVAFVTYENDLSVVPRVRFNLRTPASRRQSGLKLITHEQTKLLN